MDEDGDLIVSLPAEQIPAEGEALAQAVAARLPQIHLPALLIEVDRDTRFSERSPTRAAPSRATPT